MGKPRWHATDALKPECESDFWSAVDKTGECWLWTRGRQVDGYGRFMIGGGREMPAHRYAFEISMGPIPEGLYACHHCDNPPCVRPDHLFLGTHTDNALDAKAKGRTRGPSSLWGQHNPSATIRDPATVQEIRRRYAAGGVLQRELAVEYGITQTQVSKIVRRDSWKAAG